MPNMYFTGYAVKIPCLLLQMLLQGTSEFIDLATTFSENQTIYTDSFW